jgi:hypothetical protein
MIPDLPPLGCVRSALVFVLIAWPLLALLVVILFEAINSW